MPNRERWRTFTQPKKMEDFLTTERSRELSHNTVTVEMEDFHTTEDIEDFCTIEKDGGLSHNRDRLKTYRNREIFTPQ